MIGKEGAKRALEREYDLGKGGKLTNRVYDSRLISAFSVCPKNSLCARPRPRLAFFGGKS